MNSGQLQREQIGKAPFLYLSVFMHSLVTQNLRLTYAEVAFLATRGRGVVALP